MRLKASGLSSRRVGFLFFVISQISPPYCILLAVSGIFSRVHTP